MTQLKMRGEAKMAQLEYLVPETIDEALEMLAKGVPLAGGSALTPKRKDLRAVIDLRNLELGEIIGDGDLVAIGAVTRLQAIIETNTPLPQVFREACRLEAGWNLRNMATLGGAIMSSDGRSGLLTTLLALEAKVIQAPGSHTLPLHALLMARNEVKLITSIKFEMPANLVYEQVARAPADWPLVCVAVGCGQDDDDEIRIALGGFGEYPIRLMEAEKVWVETRDPEQVGIAAQNAYKNADDKWASAEYRAEIAKVLVRRLIKEVQD
jgi:carbon-monoxide dehydrogenase medium subunit